MNPSQFFPVTVSQTLVDPAQARLRLLMLCALMLCGLTARAGTLTVSSTADSGPGSLRDQIAAAAPGDTINFSVTGTIQLTNGVIPIAKNLTIAGPGASSLSVSGVAFNPNYEGPFSIFGISSGVVGISGLTFTNGDGTQTGGRLGGAIYMTGGTVTVTGSSFIKNLVEGSGGAIYMSNGSLAINNSTFFNNYATSNGGAIEVAAGGLAVTNSIFFGNSAPAGYGGSISIDSGSVAVTGCTISGGLASYGGGIFSDGTAMIRDSTIFGNTVASNYLTSVYYGGTGIGGSTPIFTLGVGGGIYNGDDSMTIVNCTICGNRTQFYSNDTAMPIGGGGIISFGPLTIDNSTIILNSGQNGGGILPGGTLNLSNSIVASNTAYLGNGPDIYGTVTTGDYNLVQNPRNAVLSGSHNVTLQPALLGPLTNNGGPTMTCALLVGSPAFEAGDPNFNLATTPYDQRGPGFPRMLNGRLCMGAFELEPNQTGSNFVVNTLGDNDFGTCGPADGSLREAIKYSPAGATITFGVAGTITLRLGELLVNKNLTIIGPASAPGITVSGNHTNRVFTVTQSSNAPTLFNLSTLTLSGGNGVGSVNSGGGGALFISTATPPLIVNVTNCTLSGNTAAGNGGAIRNGGTLTLTGSTIFGNTAVLSGGAIQSAGTLTVASSTLSGNSALLLGGGINLSSGSVSLYNSIVAGNSASNGPDIYGALTAGDYNLVQNPTNATLPGTHNITGQPALLGPLAYYGGPTPTQALLPGSPAIDAGSTALAADQRGLARPQGLAADIGAFELGPIFPTTLSIQASPVGQVGLSWYTVTNAWYQLQYCSALTANQWTPLGAWVAGGGQLISTNDPIMVGQAQRFYRVGVTNSP